MFKNTKLATKMAWGFGTLVVLAGVLGAVAWNGLKGMATTIALEEAGAKSMEDLNRCAELRRDFAIHGFAKPGDQELNAADQWAVAYQQFFARLQSLDSSPDLDAQNKAALGEMLDLSGQYEVAFGDQAEARKQRDAAFAEWGKVGWAVTADIKQVVESTIKPALTAARETEDLEEVLHWSGISDRLDKDVIQPFLLLRVTAVYLLATNADAQWEGYQKQLATAKAGLSDWTALVKGDAGLEGVAGRLSGHFDRYQAAGRQYYDGVLADRKASAELAATARGLVDRMHGIESRLSDDASAIASRTYTLVSSVTLSATIIGILLAVVITRSVVRPIRRIIAGLDQGADQVNDAAGQVASASQQLAAGASEQASSLEEASSSLEEMAAMTRTNAENATEANNLSGQARDAAQSGDQTMHQLNEAMAAINDSSGQINKIIKVIEEIAFQTNLLALNAAVEAARAGEHGKGFAVVADEVRNLAQRAAQAARETTSLIEDSVNRAKTGADVAGQVGQALETIVGDVAKVTDLVDGIAKASQEQAQGVDQINTAVSQMDKVTQQGAASAEESASASEQLASQAHAVKGIVDELSSIVGGSDSVRRPVAQTTPGQAAKVPSNDQTVETSTSPKVSHAASTADPTSDFMDLDETGDAGALNEF